MHFARAMVEALYTRANYLRAATGQAPFVPANSAHAFEVFIATGKERLAKVVKRGGKKD